jgi:hypothetical protein
MRGSTDSTARHAALRPARSPSKQKYTSAALRNSSSAWSGRGRGAERRDGLGHAVLRERDHVHVALDHDQAIELGIGLFRLPQAVQLAAFVEQRGLG